MHVMHVSTHKNGISERDCDVCLELLLANLRVIEKKERKKETKLKFSCSIFLTVIKINGTL